jgi:hypothetical protein
MVDDSKTMTRAGIRQMRLLTHLNGAEDRIPYAGSGNAATSSSSRAIVGPWAALIDGDDYVLDFEDPVYTITTLDPTTGNPFVSLAGTVDPTGEVWWGPVGNTYTGITDNAAAMSGGNWDPDGDDDNVATFGSFSTDLGQHGVAGGPDPGGIYGKFVNAAAGSHTTQPGRSLGSRPEGWLTAKFFAPTASTPTVMIVDMYHDREDSSLWYSPLSETEGNFFVISSYWMGYTFFTFTVLADPDNVIRRPLVLGPKPGDPNFGKFYVHPGGGWSGSKMHEWFNVAVRQTTDGYCIFVRDSETIGVNGFPQNSIHDNISGGADPGGTQGAFAGEIFAADWLQIVPGVADDPATTGPNSVEGYGISVNDFFQNYPSQFDSTGAPTGPTFNSAGVDALHFRGGFDPGATDVPNFYPNDHHLDNWVIMGEPFPLPDPKPDNTIPFLDDHELWVPGLLSLQGDDWFIDLFQNPVLTNARNHTGGGSQSAEQKDFLNSNVYQSSWARRNLPVVTGGAIDPAEMASWIYMDTTFLSRGVKGIDTVDNDVDFSHIILGGRDNFFNVDNNIYIRQPNTAASGSTSPFDPTLPTDEQSGTNVIDNGTDNVPNVNVRLTDGGGTPLTIPVGSWFEVRAQVLFDAAGNHTMTPVFDLGAGSVAGIADTAAAGNPRSVGLAGFTSGTATVNRAEWWNGGETSGFGAGIWVDDLSMDGPRQPARYIQETEGAEYASDPTTVGGWGLPWFDDMESYTEGDAAGGRGYTPFLNTVFTDNAGELDMIASLGGEVAGVTPVFTYVIDSMVIGAALGGQAPGTTVAVVDNLPAFYDASIPPVVPGSVLNSTRVNERDASRIRIAAADWTLQAGASAPWDGVTPIVGRYQFQYDARIGADDGQAYFVEDPTSAGNQVMTMDSDGGNIGAGMDTVMTYQYPDASLIGGETATVSFDMWLGDGSSPTNIGRTAVTIVGPGVLGEDIVEVIFGGPNNYEDLLSFDNGTGVISPGPDGELDTFQFNDYQSDPSNMYLRVPNPFIGATEDFVFEKQTETAPTNQWVNVSTTISSNGDWDMSITDGGAVNISYSGSALGASIGSPEINGSSFMSIKMGNDTGAGGAPAALEMEWYSLGSAANPEGGLDPLSNPAGPGSFNDTLKYFYYQISDVIAPGLNMPDITDVWTGDGTVLGVRAMGNNDQIMFWNDQSTLGMGGAFGTPLNAVRTPRNGRWHFLDSGALTPFADESDVLARGFWTALGIPGEGGIANPAPLGGIVNFVPPYNNAVPYEDILQATLVGYAPNNAQTAEHLTHIDNLSVSKDSSCTGDFDGDGDVDGGDLGLFLSTWGTGGGDFDGDGDTDGGDLGLFLAQWGACP